MTYEGFTAEDIVALDQDLHDAVRSILGAAYKFDDKPHQLFSAIRKAAEEYAQEDEKAEIIRLMDLMYDRIGELKIK